MVIEFYSTPENVHSNIVYWKWVNLLNKSVYDNSKTAYPYFNVPYTFKITNTVSPSNVYVYFNDELIETNNNSEFYVNIYPVLERTNVLYAKDDYNHQSNKIIFDVYDLHTLVFTINTGLNEILTDIKQTDADYTLTGDNSSGVLNSDLYISDKALFKNWGRVLDIRRINDTYAEYITKLRTGMDAFYYCGTVSGFKKLMSAFTDGFVDVISYMEIEELMTSFAGMVRRVAPLTIGCNPKLVKLGQDKYIFNYNTQLLSSGTENYVYVDGEVGVSGDLVMKVSSSEPLGTEQTITEIHEYINTDDADGTITGLPYGKYVYLRSPVIELGSITSSGTLKVTGAELIENSTILFLRTDWDDEYIGTITVQYTGYLRPIVLAKVTTTSDISRIEDATPSRGAIYRTRQKEESDFELYCDDENFTDAEKEQLKTLLSEINVATGMGHLYVKNPSVSLDEYEYHKDGYEYIDTI